MGKLDQLRHLIDDSQEAITKISKINQKMGAAKQSRQSNKYECMDCEAAFTPVVGSHGEIKCPECGSYDVEQA